MMKKLGKIGLLPRIIIAIILGILVGLYLPTVVVEVAATFNGLFGNFLEFAIPLIIIGFVAPGIGDLGEGAGKLLAITAAIAYGFTLFAGSLSYFTSTTLFPRILEAGSLVTDAANPEEGLVPALFVVEMPPIFGVMTALLIAFIIGLGISSIKGDTLKKAIGEFQSIVELVIGKIIIPLLPFHIFGIFANMTHAGQVATILSVFFKVFITILVLHFLMLLIQYTIAGGMTGVNPFMALKTMIPAYFTAIGTQSSAASIPVTLEQTKELGVSEDIADFVVPLGATIHLSGSTITLVATAVSVALLYGVELTFGMMLPFIMMLGVTMIAAPGVPGGAVIAAVGVIESMLGFSQPMLALVIAIYIAQDSFGTACNITGDGAIALIMDRIAGTNKEETKSEISESTN